MPAPDIAVSPSPLFDVPSIIWRALDFSVTDADRLQGCDGTHRLEVTLPPSLSRAVPQRRAEFMAGRLAAGLALLAAGQPAKVGQQGRAPVWPVGIRGSITHAGHHTIAAVSTETDCLGIDYEQLLTPQMADEIADSIITPEEAALRPDDMAFEVFLTTTFSLKEAVYKAASPRLSHIPDFHEARLLRFGNGDASLTLDGLTYHGHYRLMPEAALTVICEMHAP